MDFKLGSRGNFTSYCASSLSAEAHQTKANGNPKTLLQIGSIHENSIQRSNKITFFPNRNVILISLVNNTIQKG